MPAAMKNMVALAVIFIVSLVEAVPFSKYGRTCKDIGCPSNEICIMAEDPCTYSRSGCGRYPTCSKAGSGEQTCRTLICPSGQYCKTDNGRPVCVSASGSLGYDSAGVSTVNGQPANPQDHGSQNPNSDPYAHANAPPAEDVFGQPAKPYHPADSGSNSDLGYPPYNRNPGSGNSHPSGNNNGYSSNLGNNQQPGRNDGYPPYPTHDRMPVPGQSNHPNNQPAYPYGQGGYPAYPSGYPQQPTNGQRNPNYPNYPPSNYPSPNYPPTNTRNYNSGFRRNSGTSLVSSMMMMMIVTICFGLLTASSTALLS